MPRISTTPAPRCAPKLRGPPPQYSVTIQWDVVHTRFDCPPSTASERRTVLRRPALAWGRGTIRGARRAKGALERTRSGWRTEGRGDSLRGVEQGALRGEGGSRGCVWAWVRARGEGGARFSYALGVSGCLRWRVRGGGRIGFWRAWVVRCGHARGWDVLGRAALVPSEWQV